MSVEVGGPWSMPMPVGDRCDDMYICRITLRPRYVVA